MPSSIPAPLISVTATLMDQYYTHTEINSLFMAAGVEGDPPQGNKVHKFSTWLRHLANSMGDEVLQVVGRLLEDLVEVKAVRWSKNDQMKSHMVKLEEVLTTAGFRYQLGGRIIKAGVIPIAANLEQRIKAHNWPSVHAEFNRALEQLNRDPPSAVTAACAILESICKVYIEERGLGMPSKETLMPLWGMVERDLGLDPGSKENADVRKILGGIHTVMDGIASYRTHAGSAHGRGAQPYRIPARHAELTVGAAHVLASFIIRTWDERKGAGAAKAVS